MNKINLINKYCTSNFDTGSSEIQIILFTFKIINIKKYLKNNNKDNVCKRSLLKLLSKRNKLIKYLKKKKKKIYLKLSEDLKL